MKLSGEPKGDPSLVLAHMLWPKDPDEAATVANFTQKGRDQIDHDDALGRLIFRAQADRMKGRKASAPLKGKPLPMIGNMAGQVLLQVLALSQHYPDRANVSVAAFLLERAAKKGAFETLKDKTIVPKNQDVYRQAFYAFRPVSHLWAAQNYIMNCYTVECSDTSERKSMIAQAVADMHADYLLFLSLAEKIGNFGETHEAHGKPLLRASETWRVPDHIALADVDLPLLPQPDPSDVKSYTRRDRN